MKGLLIALLLISTSANAGKSEDKYPTEAYAATVVAYQMVMTSLEIIKSDPPGNDVVITHLEPALCWEFPIEFNEFYRVVQDGVNERVLRNRKPDQNKAGNLIGWYVWNTILTEWGC